MSFFELKIWLYRWFNSQILFLFKIGFYKDKYLFIKDLTQKSKNLKFFMLEYTYLRINYKILIFFVIRILLNVITFKEN